MAAFHRYAIRPNSPRAAMFPRKRDLIRGIFRDFLWALELVDATRVCYRGTDPQDKMTALIPARFIPETFR